MKLDSIQILRAVAALMVVLFHSINRLQYYPHFHSFFYRRFQNFGEVGVCLFFVISGFIMVHVHGGDFEKHRSIEFLRKRALRIAPLYWILTTVAVILIPIAPCLFQYRHSLPVPWVLGSYLFMPIPGGKDLTVPVIGPGWTLNYEAYFYLLFSIALFNRKLYAISAMIILFCVSIILGSIFQPSHPWLKLLTSWLLLEFCLGMLVALISPRRWSWLAIPLGALLLCVEGNFTISGNNGEASFLLWAPACALMVYGATALVGPMRTGVGRVAATLGNASYSIYLVQTFSLPALGPIVIRLGCPFDVGVVLIFLISAISGVALWAIVERPVTRWLTKRFIVRPAKPALVAA
jgi:exopolysaccharide production protein ExoZ